jgi:hypothetical protein
VCIFRSVQQLLTCGIATFYQVMRSVAPTGSGSHARFHNPVPFWQINHEFPSAGACDGNVMGFARGRGIAISPLNPLPHKTTFHELAHVLLGHTSEGDQNDGELTPRNLRECEAESVALLCCAALDLPGVEFSLATSSRGGARAIRSLSVPLNASSKLPIRSYGQVRPLLTPGRCADGRRVLRPWLRVVRSLRCRAGGSLRLRPVGLFWRLL